MATAILERLASIAHAALIEREVLDAKLEVESLADWALNSGWALYYRQSLVDLRQEPRWIPDLISPVQLKEEFLGRIRDAAERHRKNVRNAELSVLLWGESSAFQSRHDPPLFCSPRTSRRWLRGRDRNAG